MRKEGAKAPQDSQHPGCCPKETVGPSIHARPPSCGVDSAEGRMLDAHPFLTLEGWVKQVEKESIFYNMFWRRTSEPHGLEVQQQGSDKNGPGH